MTKYKLGLDIGTSSIGWAVIAFEEVETDGKSEPVDIPLEIVKSGVRLFSDGREPDSKISLASGRSTLKAQRKQKQRKFNRVKLLNEYLLKQNIISQADLDGNVYTLNAYEARNNAVSAKPELNKVLRAILHLNKHRGYFDNSIIKPNLEAIKAKEEKDILKVMEDYLGEDNQFISLSEEQKEEFVADILKIRKTKVVQENKDIYIFKTEDKEQFCNKWQSNFSNEELDKLFEEKDKKTIKTDIVKELKNAKGLKDDESRIKKGIPHLAKILEKENLTLGQFLYQKDLENEKLAKNKDTFTSQKSVRFTPESEFFASRKMYEAEFEKIRTNSLNHNILNTEQWNRIRDIIFKQYPLQSKEHLIGNCGLEIGEKVASKTSSVFQKFRSLQFLNNLQYAFVDSESDRVSYKNLNSKEKIDLLNILNKENLTTSKLEKYFNNKDKILKTNWKTSDEEGSDKGVLFKRNNTFSTMADYLGDKWSNLDLNQQNKLVEDILALEFLDINENKKEELFYNGWQSQGFTQQELDNLFKESGATKNPKTIFSELNREKGYANYSNKALFKLVEAWENQSATVDKIIEQVYGIKHEEEKGVLPDGIGYRLPYYGDISVLKNALTGEIYSPVGEELILEIARGKQTLTKKATAKPNSQLYKELTKGKINNPTVHIALNQIQVVVNSIIDEMRSKVGDDFKFSDIHLEMARDIINSPKTKEDMQKANQVNEAWNKEIDGLLGHRANRDESRKVKLWYEQQGFNLKKSPKDKANNNVEKAQCIYCGNTIGYTTDSEVDHILPISQTGDDSFTNLVLVCRQCNQEKKNQTPYDAFSNNPKYNYDELIGRAKKIYKNNPKYYRFTEKGNEIAQKLRDNFSASQLNDTRYITRVAKQYLSSLIEENHNIVCMQGKITSSYRHYLGLNDILNTLEENKKDRSDHRHHSLDAITIALISRGLVQKVSGELQGRMTNVARENYLSMQKSQMGEILRGNLQHSLMNWDGFRKQIKESLDSIIPSVKVNHKKQSALYKDTAYGIVLNSEGKPIRDSKSGQYLVKERAAIETLSLGNIKNVICLDYKANPEEPYNPEEDSLRMDIRKHLAKNDFGFEPTSWKAKGEKLSKAQEKELSDLLKSYGESRGIKKVSLKYYSAVKPINQKQKRKDTYSPLLKASITENVANSPFKAYAVDSYKCVDIYQIVAKVDAKTKAETLGYHGNFILYADFAEHKGNRGDISYKSSENFQEILEKDKNKKPKFLMRLHKDDTVVAYQKIDGKDIPFLFAVKALAAVRRRLGLRPLLLSNSKQQDYGIDKIVSLEPESGNDFFALKKVAVLPNGEIKGIDMKNLPKEYTKWLEEKKKEAKKDKKTQENNNNSE